MAFRGEGVLETLPDGFGFLRAPDYNYLPGPDEPLHTESAEVLIEGEAIVASIGFKWFSPDHTLHYSGPGESWWGADLAVVPHGKGRAVVSQLRIVENLGAVLLGECHRLDQPACRQLELDDAQLALEMLTQRHVVDIDDIDELGELRVELADRRVGSRDDQGHAGHGWIIRSRDIKGIDVIAP